MGGRRKRKCSTCAKPVKGHKGPTGKGCEAGEDWSTRDPLEGFVIVDEARSAEGQWGDDSRDWWGGHSRGIDNESASSVRTRGDPGRVTFADRRPTPRYDTQGRDTTQSQEGARQVYIPPLSDSLSLGGHGLPPTWSGQVPIYSVPGAMDRPLYNPSVDSAPHVRGGGFSGYQDRVNRNHWEPQEPWGVRNRGMFHATYGQNQREVDRAGVTEDMPMPMDVGLEFLAPGAVNTAISGEFTNLEEFVNPLLAYDFDVLDSSGTQARGVRARKSITSIVKWLEAWLHYEMVLTKFFGYEVYYQMARYRAFILHISQKFKYQNVLSYDTRHRQRLAQTRSLAFARMDHELFIMTFDASAAKPAVRCGKCTSVEHSSSDCNVKQKSAGPRASTRPEPDKSEVCFRFQQKRCRWGAKCFRRHCCAGCGGPDPQSACSKPSCKSVTGALPASA